VPSAEHHVESTAPRALELLHLSRRAARPAEALQRQHSRCAPQLRHSHALHAHAAFTSFNHMRVVSADTNGVSHGSVRAFSYAYSRTTVSDLDLQLRLHAHHSCKQAPCAAACAARSITLFPALLAPPFIPCSARLACVWLSHVLLHAAASRAFRLLTRRLLRQQSQRLTCGPSTPKKQPGAKLTTYRWAHLTYDRLRVCLL
jgi:hypothetical protein